MIEETFCCEAFAREVHGHSAFAGGGFLYPPGSQPIGQIERNSEGGWAVNGCCGGGCYVLPSIAFCPFCGSKLKQADKGAQHG